MNKINTPSPQQFDQNTLFDRLNAWVDAAPQHPAQRFKQGSGWQNISTTEYRDRCFYLALFLESKGFRSGDVSAIFSYNCPQWAQMDLAPSLVGGLSAGIYPNSNQKDIQHILSMTQAKVVCVQDKEYFQKLIGAKGEHPIPAHVEFLLVFNNDVSISPKAVAYEAAIAEGKRLAQGRSLKSYLDKMDPHAPGFLIFTSGTTGLPKGVMISQNNMVCAADVVRKGWAFPKGGHELFSFLPLSHIAEKVHNLGVGICWQGTVNYCTKFDNLSLEIGEVNPTILLAVPRLWEKMKEGVERKLSEAPAIRQNLAKWALKVGERVARAKFAKKSPALTDLLQYAVADRLVLSKIRKALGFSRLKLGGSGAAPLAGSVVWWFRFLGVEIVELYGMTETTAIIAFNYPGEEGSGTVGRPAPGIEFKLDTDGEICTRGRLIFKGYFKNDKATQEVMDSEGWLHTGDLGAIDERGYVRIIGRKRDILKTSGGKMLAPAPVEEKIKSCSYVGQVCVVGDNRKYFVAVVTLSEGAAAKGGTEAHKNEQIRSEIQKHFDAINRELASYEQIKRFVVLERDFSIEKGEMTPTLKMKRNVIEQNFQDVIESLYS